MLIFIQLILFHAYLKSHPPFGQISDKPMVWTIFGQHATMLLDIGRTSFFLKVAPLPPTHRPADVRTDGVFDLRPQAVELLRHAHHLHGVRVRPAAGLEQHDHGRLDPHRQGHQGEGHVAHVQRHRYAPASSKHHVSHSQGDQVVRMLYTIKKTSHITYVHYGSGLGFIL